MSIFDSWVTGENTVQSLGECIDGAKAIVIVTEHSDVVEKIEQMEFAYSEVETVIDARNCLDGKLIE